MPKKTFKAPDLFGSGPRLSKSTANRSARYGFILLILLSVNFHVLAVPKSSTGSGNWNSSSSWSPSGVPASGDAVTINTGHTITINTNTASIGSLSVLGTLIIGNNNTNRTITVTGNIIINSGGSFRTTGNGGNVLNVRGNITNNGTFDMNIGSADAAVVFNGITNQFLSGSGGITDIADITLTNTGAANNNILEISTLNFTADPGFLSLTDGILKVSGSFSFSNTFFNTASPTINADEGLWLNNINVTVTGQNGDTRLYGLLRISAGSYNIGVGANFWLVYYTGSQLIMEGGELNITGAFFGNTTNDAITYQQSAGTVNVCTNANNYNVASFEIWAPASNFIMSGGKIVLERQATAFTDYVNYSTNATITGGVIQAGGLLTLPTSVFWINSTPALYDLEIKSLNNPYFQLRSNTQVINDVLIGGVLDAASQNVALTVGGDWINNGIFLPATSAAVTFNGSASQTIGGLLTSTFNNLVFSNTSGGISLSRTVNVSTSAIFTAGIVTSTTAAPLVFLDNAVTSGANNNPGNPSFVHGPVRKAGNDSFTFPVGKMGNGYHPCSISAPLLITDIFTAEYIRGSAGQLGSITSPGLSHVSNCDYWDIDRTIGISAVDVTLSWNGYSNCNSSVYVTQLSSLVVAHFNGTSWNTHSANSTTGSPSSGTVTRNKCTAFSIFSLGSTSAASNPLPVKLSSVKAYASGSINRIEWTNETEQGVSDYIIEKAWEGQVFSSIGKKFPQGNTGGRSIYDFSDHDVNNEENALYRIKVLETTGEFKYSPVVKVSRKNKLTGITLYPNPVSGRQLSMQLNNMSAGSYQAAVYDQSGRMITSTGWEHRGGTLAQTIDLPSGCSAGIYLINIRGKGIHFSEKLIIQ